MREIKVTKGKFKKGWLKRALDRSRAQGARLQARDDRNEIIGLAILAAFGISLIALIAYLATSNLPW